jgi:hypothetical protein
METAKKYYVVMNDDFMSGWGQAEGKINKLVILCESLEEAKIVMGNALARKEMKYVRVGTGNIPRYSKNRYHVSVHDKSDYGNWFIPNFIVEES